MGFRSILGNFSLNTTRLYEKWSQHVETSCIFCRKLSVALNGALFHLNISSLLKFRLQKDSDKSDNSYNG